VSRALKLARWIAWAVFFAAAYRLAFWHHDDPFAVFVATPAFWTLLSAWTIAIFIWVIERKS
jgi:hypothetical protein